MRLIISVISDNHLATYFFNVSFPYEPSPAGNPFRISGVTQDWKFDQLNISKNVNVMSWRSVLRGTAADSKPDLRGTALTPGRTRYRAADSQPDLVQSHWLPVGLGRYNHWLSAATHRTTPKSIKHVLTMVCLSQVTNAVTHLEQSLWPPRLGV